MNFLGGKMTKYEMEEEIARLKDKKRGLTQAKTDIQAQISELNTVNGSHLNPKDFRRIRQERAEYCRMMTDIDRQIAPLNEEIRRLSLEKGQKSEDAVKSKTTIEALCAIREEYQLFAADKTRVGSMRQMAAEFVTKLNPIIRKAVND